MSTKRCNTCRKPKPLTEYHRHPGTKDGHQARCKKCANALQAERRLLPKCRAVAAWHDLNKRVKNQPEYAGVLVLVTREEFVPWATEKFARWGIENPGIRPSVDRRDPAGHYEMDNLQIISLTENCRRARRNKNVHAPTGQAWCGTCVAYKPVAEFGSNSSRPHGLQNRCNACRTRQRIRRRNPNWKNDQAPTGTLWCGKCENHLPEDSFYTCRTTKTGRQTSCKTCQNSRGRREQG